MIDPKRNENVDVMSDFNIDPDAVTDIANTEGIPHHAAHSAEEKRLVREMVEAIRVEAHHRYSEVKRRLNRLRGSNSSVAFEDVWWCLWAIRRSADHEANHFSIDHFYKRFPQDEPNIDHKELFVERMDKFCQQAGIPEEFWRMEWRDIDVRADVEGFKDAYVAVKGYGREAIRDGKGFLFRRSPGTGKTTLAAMAAKAGIRHGFTVVFATAPSIIDAHKPSGDIRLKRKVYESDLLIVDDLGEERPTEFTLAEWDRLISERYNHKKATIYTSNFSGDELQGTYSPRLIDRIRDRCEGFDFDGDSYRGRE